MKNNLKSVLYQFERQHMAADYFSQKVTDGVFIEQRDRLLAAYAAMFRMHYEIDRRNAAFPGAEPMPHPPQSESREWCNAAIHILAVAEEGTQRFFLSADRATKNKLVQAVIDDQGIETADGYWAELPQ